MEPEMKNKHQGLVRSIMFFLSIGLLIGYGYYMAAQIQGSVQISSPAILPRIKLPDAAIMNYIRFLSHYLDDLSRPDGKYAGIDLKIFGDTTHEKQRQITDDVRTEAAFRPVKESAFSYRVSLSFASQKISFCIIDKKLYKQNAMLPDGGRILKIENDRVLIKKQNLSDWIYPMQKKH